MELIMTITPQRRWRMPGATMRLRRSDGKTIQSTAALHSESGAARLAREPPPALLTRMSTCPNAPMAPSTRRRQPDSVVTSAAIASTVPPAARISSAVACSVLSVRPLRTTRAPSCASADADALPSPRLEPVTIATRFFSPRSIRPGYARARGLQVFPGDEHALHPAQQQRAGEADHGNHQQADVHLLHLEDLPAGPDQVAQAAPGADELGRDDHQQGDAHAELHAGEDERQGAREGDVAEHHQPTGVEVLAHVEVDPVDVAHTRHRVDQDQGDDGRGDDRVLALLTNAENH